jgi:predicted RNA-binding Zn-ribbon protein involved in translation (DUF1610 family)
MMKAIRVPERAFTIAMWVVSLIFSGFLTGLGQLVIGDLPRVENPVVIEQFVDPKASARIQGQRSVITATRDQIQQQIDIARPPAEAAHNDYAAKREAFDNWIATRQATTDAKQDPEVISRTKILDDLNDKARARDKVIEDLNVQMGDLDRQMSDLDRQRAGLEEAAQSDFEGATFKQDLKVFVYRLALTLPLLVLAGWMIRKKRNSAYWPLMRGFALFALYAFFVELVPYLPSYGGYIRYIVGIILTIVASHYLIKWMQHYLANRVVAEQKAEVERKQSIRYEDALKKMSANVCPGCERPVATTGDVLADYCVHCGMQLFDKCVSCATRKLAFFHYCMSCGTAAKAKAETAGAPVAVQPS